MEHDGGKFEQLVWREGEREYVGEGEEEGEVDLRAVEGREDGLL